MKIERILMPTDFSGCAQAAFDHALVLARQYDAELHVLNVVELHAAEPIGLGPAFPDLEEIHERLDGIASGEMGKLLARHADRTLMIQDAVRRGIAAAPSIVEYAEEQGVDLIVLGTHGRRGLRRLLLGSVAEEVVRTARCPVLTIRGDHRAQTEGESAPKPFDHIVVPYDFSADSDHALTVARQIAPTGGRIEVVHVIAPPMDPEMFAPMHDPGRSFSFVELRAEVERRLVDRVAGHTGPEVPIEVHVLDGHAASVLADYADSSQADLIVIASHGLSGLRRFLLGSVTSGVVRAAMCPVLTVRGGSDPEDA